jgi:hypothetical protein
MQEKYVGYETCFVCRYNFFPKHYSLRPVYMKSCVVGASVVLVCSDVNSMLALSGFNRTFKMWTDFIKYFQYQILENSVSLFCVSYGKMRRESVASKSKQCCIDVELEVLTAVNVNSISCDKMKCSPLKVNRSCGSKWLIRLQNGRISQACDQREVGSYIKTILNYIHLIFKLIFSYLKLLWSGWWLFSVSVFHISDCCGLVGDSLQSQFFIFQIAVVWMWTVFNLSFSCFRFLWSGWGQFSVL